MKYAPIALFIYKRPEHTRRMIASLATCPEFGDSPVFVFCDGARKAQDLSEVKAARRVARELLQGAEATFIEADVNQGLAASIVSGVGRLCDTFGCAIVVEDDLVVAPQFIAFMNAALSKYADEERVMQISGYMFPADLAADTDAIFFPLTTSWGWATWQRAWKHFDINASGYEVLKRSRKSRRRFDLDGAYPYFNMLRDQLNGRIDSWAIRWYLSVFLANGLVLFPRRTLVENIGFDGSGEHCSRWSTPTVSFSTGAARIERLPSNIEVDSVFPQYIDYVRKNNSFGRKILGTLRSAFSPRLMIWN